MKTYRKAQNQAFQVLPNGMLRISRVRGQLREMRDFLKDNQNDHDFLWEFYESELCNGYSRVSPETIGALTDGVLIANEIVDDETTQAELDKITVWWHEAYQVQGLGNTILKQGYIDLPSSN